MSEEYVEMIGTGSASGVPDVSVLTLRVEYGAGQVETALGGCAESAEAVLAQLRGNGIEPADLQTTSLRVDPRWDPQTGGADGYTASQGMTVRIRDVRRVGDLVSSAATAGGDRFRMNGLAWSVADASGLHRTARERAWRDALEKARQVCTLAGRELGAVQQLREVEPGGIHVRGAMRAATLEAGSMPVAAGEDTVEVSLLVRWALLPV